jgi:hypothetical protein
MQIDIDFPVYRLHGLAETLRQLLDQHPPLERSERLWQLLDLVAAVRAGVADATRLSDADYRNPDRPDARTAARVRSRICSLGGSQKTEAAKCQE